jgi:class 3 adenylate cyclase/tetratricopeptide (TPR) repeat protein
MPLSDDPRARQVAQTPFLAAEGKRCRLTVLFCDLSGSTALSGDMEAEDYAELLGALRQLYAAAVAAHGGTLVRIQGDGMLAIFGWPQPREGDSRRAVETAVQLHQQVAALRGFGPHGRDVDLRLHSGIHAGLVLVQRGDAMVGSLELLGMAPNIAGRLSDAAGRDEILVSEDCLGPDLHHFETGPARAVAVYGPDTRLAARAIHGRGQTISAFEARTRRRLQPFIGRQAELRELDRVLGQMLGGATLRLALAAPPGVGKTRLAREVLQRARQKGCRVLAGHATEALSDAPLQPLVEMLRAALPAAAKGRVDEGPAIRTQLQSLLAGLQREDLEPALADLLGLAASAHTPVGDAPPTALAALLERLAETQPLVLFLDDWQWADASTRQLLSTLGRDNPGLPLLVLATTRGIDDGDAELFGIRVLPLSPFTPAETTDSVRQLLPQADPFLATEICLYSGGNPLYVEELCRSAEHADPERWLVRRLGGSNWLNVLVESRVARLPAEQADLVRLAAVVGTTIPPGLLQALSGRDADDDALLALADEDLLFADADGGFHFKHGLTRDVVYESVGLQQRRALHDRVAQVLQARTPPDADPPHEALATHCMAAGRAADAAIHAEIAADRAAALSVLDRARALYHLALTALDQADPEERHTRRWLSISDRLGLVSVFDGARADLPVFERGVARARALGDAGLVARAEHSLGYVLYALGESVACISHLQNASAAAGAGDDPLAVQIRATLGQALAASADYPAAERALDEAVAIKRRHRRPGRNSVGLAYGLVCLASVHGDRGAFALAHALLDEAWSVVDGHGHQIGASIQGWRSAILTWQGRWTEAREVAQESAWIAERTRSLFQFCQGRVTAAYADWRLSGDARFVEVADQATGWLEPRDSGLFRSLNHGWLVDAWLGVGERARARRHAALALRRGRLGDVIGVAMTSRALALDAADHGDAARARRWLARAEAVAARRQSAHETACNRLCAAQLAAREGRDGEARQTAAAAQRDFTALQMDDHARLAQRLLGD